MTTDDLSPARFAAAFEAFMDAVLGAAPPPPDTLRDRLRAHLGGDPGRLPVVAEQFDPFQQPNVQVALGAYASGGGREVELVGLAADHKRYGAVGLSDLLGRGQLAEGPIDHVNFRLASGRVLACVQFGLYLVAAGEDRLVVLVAGPADIGSRPKLRVEVAAARPEAARAFLADLAAAMRRHDVYRGHVLSLSPGRLGMGPQTLVVFHDLPPVARADVVLPPGVLERIERHTVGVAAQADRLRAARRSLKRGVLLHGPPGTGKTLTVLYLLGRLPGRTTLLVTDCDMGLLQAAVQLARALAPSTVVLEDVDLIAEERGQPHGRGGPLLYALLNELDGLHDDADVLFVLTTNRPEALEPALAARPGRIDLVVELPLPDAKGRRRLLARHALGLAVAAGDLDALADRLAGASPAYLKAVLRTAALLAALEGGAMAVTAAHLAAAAAEVNQGGRVARSLLGVEPGPAEVEAAASEAAEGPR